MDQARSDFLINKTREIVKRQLSSSVITQVTRERKEKKSSETCSQISEYQTCLRDWFLSMWKKDNKNK